MFSFKRWCWVALLALLAACVPTVDGQTDFRKVTKDGVVYLAHGGDAIERYDLLDGVWLDGFVQGSGESISGFVIGDKESVYGWQSDQVVDVNQDFRLIERFGSEVVSSVVLPGGLLVMTESSVSILADGEIVQVGYDDKPERGFQPLHSLADTPEGRVYGLQENGGLSELVLPSMQALEWQRNGSRSFPAKRLYHDAASQRFIDSQGVAYDVETLSFTKGLTESFRDLVFLNNGGMAVLRDDRLSLYDRELRLTHSKELEEPADTVELADPESLVLFRSSGVAPQGFTVETVSLSEFEEATENVPPVVTQEEAFYRSNELFAGQGLFHLVSRPRGQVTRIAYGDTVSSDYLPLDHGFDFVAKHPDDARIFTARSGYAKIRDMEIDFLLPTQGDPGETKPVIAGLTVTAQSVMLGVASDGHASRGIDELRVVQLENDSLFTALLAERLDPSEVVHHRETQRTYFYTAEPPSRLVYRKMIGQNLVERQASSLAIPSRDLPLTITVDGGHVLVGSGQVLDAVTLEPIKGLFFRESFEHLVAGPSSFLTTKTVAGQTQMDVWDASTLAHVGRVQFPGEADAVLPASNGCYVFWPSGQLIDFDAEGLPRAASFPQGLQPVTKLRLTNESAATTRSLSWQDPNHGAARAHSVEAREGPADSWTEVATVDGSRSMVSIPKDAGPFEEFRVVSRVGESVVVSASVFLVPEKVLVGRGYDFKLTHQSASTATVSWRDTEAFETGWEIVTDSGTVVYSLSSDVTEATITGLASGKAYSWRIRARRSFLEGPTSPEVRFALSEDLAVLPPSDLRVSWRSARRVDLQWMDHAINEAGYKLLRTRLDISEDENVEAHLLPINSDAFTDTTVIPGATYRYALSVTGDHERRLVVEVTTPLVSEETTRAFAHSDDHVYVSQPNGEIARFDMESGVWLGPVEVATGSPVVTMRADGRGVDLLTDDNTVLRWNVDGTRQTVTHLDHRPGLLLGTSSDVLTVAGDGLLSANRNSGTFTWTSSVAPLTYSFAGNADKGIIVGRGEAPSVRLVVFDPVGQIIAASTMNADTGSQLFLSPDATTVVSNSGQSYRWDGTSLSSWRRDLGGSFDRLVFQGNAPMLLRGDVLAIYDNELLPVADHVFGEPPSMLASSLKGVLFAFFEDWTRPQGFRVVSLSLTELGLLPSGERVPTSIELSRPLPSPVAIEDDLYESTLSFVDRNGNDLALTLVQGPDWLVFRDQGNGVATLSGTPLDGTSNGTIIGVGASDGAGQMAFYSFVLSVKAVDDGPEVRQMDPIVVNEDAEPTLLDLDEIFLDEEDAILASKVSVLPLSEEASKLIVVKEAPSITGTTFRVDYLPDAFGETSFQLAFRDSNGAEAIASILVHVLAVNDRPKGKDIALTLKQGETARLSLLNLFYDPDDPIRRDHISLLEGHEEGAIVSFEGGSSDTQIKAFEDVEGEFMVTYRLNLPGGGFVDSRVSVTVEQPFLPLRPRHSFHVRANGEPLVIDLRRFYAASGWDTDLLSYAIDVPAPGSQYFGILPVPDQAGTISVQGLQEGSGTLEVVATGQDNFRQELLVSVVVGPELNVVERVVRYPFEVLEDSEPLRIELADLFRAAIGRDVVGFEVRQDPFIDGLATLSTREASEPQLVLLNLVPNAHGSTTISLLLEEDGSGAMPIRIDLKVTVVPVPDAPSTAGFAPLILSEDDAELTWKLSDHFSDPEDTARGLRYLASLDAGLEGVLNISFDAPWDLLTLAPEPDRYGSGIFTIVATDQDGLSVTTTQEIVIEPINDPPAIQSLEPIVVSEDGPTPTIALEDIVSDLEDAIETLTISVSADAALGEILAPSVDPETQALSLTLFPDRFGSGSLRLVATDSGGLAAESTVSIIVEPSPDPPTVVGFGESPLIVPEDAPTITYSLWDFFVDQDGPSDQLTFQVSLQEPEAALLSAAINEATGVLSLTPMADAFGQGAITVTATDADDLSVSRSLSYSVTSVPDAPRVAGIHTAFLNEDDSPVTLRLFELFSDVDSSIDALSYRIQFPGASSAPFTVSTESRDDSFTLNPRPDQFGNGVMTIEATDDTGLTTELAFEVRVLPLPDAPQVSRNLPDVTVRRGTSPLIVSLKEVFADADLNTDLVFQASSDNPDLVLTTESDPETVAIDFQSVSDGTYEIVLSAEDETGLMASVQFAMSVVASPLPDRRAHVATVRYLNQMLEIGVPLFPGVSQVLQSSADGLSWLDVLALGEPIGDYLWWRVPLQSDTATSLFRLRLDVER